MSYQLRVATLSDIVNLEELISLSAYGLSLEDYTAEQIQGALKGVFGVDTQLIKDNTYYLLENHGELVACGGWSFRATLFGNDSIADRDPRLLDPQHDAAKIRAFFVHPNHARRGLARRLLLHCEQCAADAGFTGLELGATLPGKRFYEACGYKAGTQIDHVMENGLVLPVVPMFKSIAR